MKKLNKLQINSEKLMKNEELLTLRGGYGGGTGTLACYREGWASGCMTLITYMNTTCTYAMSVCSALGGSCIKGC
jgi:hypothetical protein